MYPTAIIVYTQGILLTLIGKTKTLKEVDHSTQEEPNSKVCNNPIYIIVLKNFNGGKFCNK